MQPWRVILIRADPIEHETGKEADSSSSFLNKPVDTPDSRRRLWDPTHNTQVAFSSPQEALQPGYATV